MKKYKQYSLGILLLTQVCLSGCVNNHNVTSKEVKIENGTTTHIYSSKEGQLLFSAIESGDIKAVKKIIENHPESVNANYTNQGCFHLEAIKALHAAIKHKHPEVLELLLTKGANPEGINIYEPTSLLHNTRLTSENKEAYDKIISESGYKSPKIEELLKKNDVDTKFKEKNKDVMKYTGGADTPLMYAISKSDMDSIKILVENGANVNGLNNIGRSPLHQLTKFRIKDSQEILDYFLSKGANINLQDNFGMTPLYLAAFIDNVDAVNMFLKHGADPKIKSEGKTIIEFLYEKSDRLKNSNNQAGLEYVNKLIQILEPLIKKE